MCAFQGDKEKEGGEGCNVNSLFCLRAGGAIDSGGNHITGKTEGLAESSDENVFPLPRIRTHLRPCLCHFQHMHSLVTCLNAKHAVKVLQ